MRLLLPDLLPQDMSPPFLSPQTAVQEPLYLTAPLRSKNNGSSFDACSSRTTSARSSTSGSDHFAFQSHDFMLRLPSKANDDALTRISIAKSHDQHPPSLLFQCCPRSLVSPAHPNLDTHSDAIHDAIRDPLRHESQLFIRSYVEACKKMGECGTFSNPHLYQFLKASLCQCLENPLHPGSEDAIQLWAELKELTSSNGGQDIMNVIQNFDKIRLDALQECYIYPALAFPFRIRVAETYYILTRKTGQIKTAIYFEGYSQSNPAEYLEFKIFYNLCLDNESLYKADFDALRLAGRLVDYDQSHQLLIAKRLYQGLDLLIRSPDSNCVASFQNYSWGTFLLSQAAYVAEARSNPLMVHSQSFMIKYLYECELIGFDQRQRRFAAHQFLKDIVGHAVRYPFAPASQKSIRFWISQCNHFFKESEIEELTRPFNLAQVEALRSTEYTVSNECFPIRIKIAEKSFILTAELGRGGYGVVFDGIEEDVPQQALVIKLIHEERDFKVSFHRELRALRQLNRLEAYDLSLKVIVQKKVLGIPLDKILMKETRSSILAQYQSQYRELSYEFYLETGLCHGDIRPANVIVAPDGKFHLIDFGMTVSTFPQSDPRLADQLDRDSKRAQREYRFFYCKLDAWKAKCEPSSPGAKEAIQEYIRQLKSTGRLSDVPPWESFFSRNYGVQLSNQ